MVEWDLKVWYLFQNIPNNVLLPISFATLCYMFYYLSKYKLSTALYIKLILSLVLMCALSVFEI